MADSMGKGSGSNIAGDMVSVQMGMAMGQQMINNLNNSSSAGANQPVQQNAAVSDSVQVSDSKFCPECGTPVNGAKFCSNCGKKLI